MLLVYNKKISNLVRVICLCVQTLNSGFWCVGAGARKNECSLGSGAGIHISVDRRIPGGNRYGLRRKRLYELETNGGSHRHPRLLDVVS